MKAKFKIAPSVWARWLIILLLLVPFSCFEVTTQGSLNQGFLTIAPDKSLLFSGTVTAGGGSSTQLSIIKLDK